MVMKSSGAGIFTGKPHFFMRDTKMEACSRCDAVHQGAALRGSSLRFSKVNVGDCEVACPETAVGD